VSKLMTRGFNNFKTARLWTTWSIRCCLEAKPQHLMFSSKDVLNQQTSILTHYIRKWWTISYKKTSWFHLVWLFLYFFAWINFKPARLCTTWSVRCCLKAKPQRLMFSSKDVLNGRTSILNHCWKHGHQRLRTAHRPHTLNTKDSHLRLMKKIPLF